MEDVSAYYFLSHRGIGKTTSAEKYAVERYREKGYHFVILRNTNEEIKEYLKDAPDY